MKAHFGKVNSVNSDNTYDVKYLNMTDIVNIEKFPKDSLIKFKQDKFGEIKEILTKEYRNL